MEFFKIYWLHKSAHKVIKIDTKSSRKNFISYYMTLFY